MRTLFLVLLLANVVFFAWSRYVSPSEAGADPAPLARQIEPEKLKVVTPAELPPPAPAPSPVSARPLPAIAAKCIEWGSFTLTDAPRAEKALEPLGLGARLGQRRTEEVAGWWVFIPPQGNGRQGAMRKATELKSLGIDDYFIVQEDGPHRWAVSLGVFRSEEAARARLTTLRAQGVRSAQVGPRETTVPKVWLQVKGVDGSLEARLRDVAREVEGSELRSCP
ncbi:MAG: SPOR domain-containing protein [Anaeromyxobacteraceae bacterium]